MTTYFLKKLLNNEIDCPYLLSIVNWKIPQVSTRSNYKITFFIPIAKTNLSKHSPLWRMSKLANNCETNLLFRPETDYIKVARNKFLNVYN